MGLSTPKTGRHHLVGMENRKNRLHHLWRSHIKHIRTIGVVSSHLAIIKPKQTLCLLTPGTNTFVVVPVAYVTDSWLAKSLRSRSKYGCVSKWGTTPVYGWPLQTAENYASYKDASHMTSNATPFRYRKLWNCQVATWCEQSQELNDQISWRTPPSWGKKWPRRVDGHGSHVGIQLFIYIYVHTLSTSIFIYYVFSQFMDHGKYILSYGILRQSGSLWVSFFVGFVS